MAIARSRGARIRSNVFAYASRSFTALVAPAVSFFATACV